MQSAQRRLDRWLEQAGQLGAKSASLAEPIEEISVSLEELNVALEELHQKQAELQAANLAIAKEKQRYQELFEFAPDGYLVTNATGIIQEANFPAAKLLDRHQARLVGKPLLLFISQAERPAFSTLLKRLEQEECIRGLELCLQPHNQSSFPVDISVAAVRDEQNRVTGLRWLLRDITQLKAAQAQSQQTQAALKSSEEQLRLITDNLPVLIAYVDSQQHFRFNNRAYEDWFEQPLTAITGKHIQEVLGEAVYQQIKPYVETVLSGQNVSFEMEIPYREVSSRWVKAIYIAHLDEGGAVRGFFALIDDISERKAIEKMKQDFISIVSHELRTPLTLIHGPLKLLAEGQLGSLPAEAQKMLDIANQSTERLVSLVNDILDIQRMESGNWNLKQQRCDAGKLMGQVIEIMQGMAQQQQLVLSINPISVPLWVDPDKFIQIGLNLLSNAMKFAFPGSTIWFTAKEEDNQVLFQLKDRGKGIPTDRLESIFGFFQQVDCSDSREKGGTGLGLAICRKIVVAHGGKIWAESTLGEGSSFYFTLPKFSD